MRIALRAVACLAALALSCLALPAHADPNACGQPGNCTGAHCHEGWEYGIILTGAGSLQGSVLCRDNPTIHCFQQHCSGVAVASGDMGCDLTQGQSAICYALDTVDVPQPILDLVDQVLLAVDQLLRTTVDPLLCPILAELAPTVRQLIPELIYIDDTGDTQVLNAPFWDCPPYES
jgi:hypothetical protein